MMNEHQPIHKGVSRVKFFFKFQKLTFWANFFKFEILDLQKIHFESQF